MNNNENMVDIIIPAYNAHETIIRVLSSLQIQININLAKIYIINDCSKKNYKTEISMFNEKLNIVELKTLKNLGPGGARQYGLNNSNAKYIIFLDADDQFYNPYSFNLLYSVINNDGFDLVYSREYVEKEKMDYYNHGSLHGKIYRREYIEKNNIKFNNTRYSEDTSFNQIIKHSSNNIKEIDYITYLYLDNDTSITKNSNRAYLLLMYIYNMIWVCLELKKRSLEESKIISVILFVYIKIFKEITGNDKKNIYKDIYIKGYRLEFLYKTYEKNINYDSIINTIRELFQCNFESAMCIYKDFQLFRKKFKVKI